VAEIGVRGRDDLLAAKDGVPQLVAAERRAVGDIEVIGIDCENAEGENELGGWME
jgi:hypothetical protein